MNEWVVTAITSQMNNLEYSVDFGSLVINLPWCIQPTVLRDVSNNLGISDNT